MKLTTIKKIMKIAGIFLLFLTILYISIVGFAIWQFEKKLEERIERVELYFSEVTVFPVQNLGNQVEEEEIYLSLFNGKGVMVLNKTGGKKSKIEALTKYATNINIMLQDDENQLWLFPGIFVGMMYWHNVPFIYVINKTTGKITKRISTNTSDSAGAACFYEGEVYVAFDNSGFKQSFGVVKNNTVETMYLPMDMSLIDGFICTNTSMIVSYYRGVVRYNFSNPKQFEILDGGVANDDFTHQFSQVQWDGNNTLYYLKNSSKIIKYNLKTKEKISIPIAIKPYTMLYYKNELYFSTSDTIYRYNLTSQQEEYLFKNHNSNIGLFMLDEKILLLGGNLFYSETGEYYPLKAIGKNNIHYALKGS